MSKDYPSNLTRAQYEFLSDLLPEAKPGGRPREVDLWEALNAILYLLVEGMRVRLRVCVSSQGGKKRVLTEEAHFLNVAYLR